MINMQVKALFTALTLRGYKVTYNDNLGLHDGEVRTSGKSGYMALMLNPANKHTPARLLLWLDVQTTRHKIWPVPALTDATVDQIFREVTLAYPDPEA